MGKTVKKIAKVVTDPANVFGKRDGGMSMAGMIDPGGEILGAAGIEQGRQLADPGKLLASDQMTGKLPEPMEIPEIPSMADTTAKLDEERRKRAASKQGRASTILTSGMGSGELGRANIGATTLGGR
jgi:hypothetical protein